MSQAEKIKEVVRVFTNAGAPMDRISTATIAALARCLIKRKGKLVIRKTEPDFRKDPEAWCAFVAWRSVKNIADWGYDGAWRDGTTAKLMFLEPEHRALMEQCMDDYALAQKAHREKNNIQRPGLAP